MPKKTEEQEEHVEKSDRELRWEKFLESHKKQNPLKHAERLERHELDRIPDTFL